MDINGLRERKSAAMSISELNNYIKGIVESNAFLSSVTVKGEISNFVNHRSGHLYFSLKDNDSQIRAVMFRSSAIKLKFVPESGMKVIVHGSVAVYQRDGTYQLYISSMQPDGVGALYLAYEQLKEKLYREGLFDEDHKRILPLAPQKIGVITSPTGAAVRDIINVIGRRFPIAKIYLYPSLVQGDGAEEDLCNGIEFFERSKLVDVIIIGRGGGSIEDLWAFNSEKLARKIYNAKTPIISAVGHETDFTICDFVADMRAPTPSAAAELSVPDMREVQIRIDSYAERCDIALKRKLDMASERLNNIKERLLFTNIKDAESRSKEQIKQLGDRLATAMNDKIESHERLIESAVQKLDAINPLNVLKRGYSITTNLHGNVVNLSNVNIDDEIEIRILNGKIKAEIIDINEVNYE